MAITPAPGWMVDPNNPNGVVPIGSQASINNPNANIIAPGSAPYQAPVVSSGTITRTSQPVQPVVQPAPQKVPAPQPAPVAPQPAPAAPAPQPAASTAAPAAPAPGAAPVAAPAQKSSAPNLYTGPSIVDYLHSVGQASDFASRAKLAEQYGIKNYTHSAAQNTQLLNTLRASNPPTPQPTVTTPSGTVGESGTIGKAATENSSTGDGTNPSTPDHYAGLDPIQKQAQMYKDAYNAVGLPTLKERSDEYAQKLSDIENELNDKKQGNQNNPWLSQGLVDKMNQQLDAKYAVKIDTFTHLQALADSLYKEGLARVDHMVSDANADIKATNDLAQKQIDAANTLAKDNIIQSVGGRELLVNKLTGKTVADLGPVTPSSSAMSLADKEALASFNAALKTAGSGSSGGNSDTLQGMLNYYNSTGKLPAFGLSANNPLRAQFYAALGGADGSTQINNAQANAAVRAGMQKAYATQQNQYQATQTAIGTLNKQLALAQTYSNQVGRSGSPLINKYLLSVKSGVFGDPDTAALHNIVTTASYEFAKILSGAAASIAGVSVSSQQDAESLLNSAMSKGQFNEVLGLMEKESNYRLSSQKDTIASIEKDLKNIGTSNTTTSNSGDTASLAAQYGI